MYENAWEIYRKSCTEVSAMSAWSGPPESLHCVSDATCAASSNQAGLGMSEECDASEDVISPNNYFPLVPISTHINDHVQEMPGTSGGSLLKKLGEISDLSPWASMLKNG